MTPLFTAFITLVAETGTRFWFTVISIAFAVSVVAAMCVGFVQDWIERTRGRNWPTVSGVIEIVSVALIEDEVPSPKADLVGSCYRATLTYTYNNPEPQMGDYSRDFADKEEANAWANSYRGETVQVHVDPRDPTCSLLRKEDL